jgi:hemoglobin/transferrin/lactoferrin receptor protein
MPLLTAALLGSVVAVGASAYAQSSGRTVHGVVRDPLGAPIAAAIVDIQCGAEHRQTMTTSGGEFVATQLPATRCRITAASPSFEPVSYVVDQQTDGPLTIVLQISRLAHEVVVTPARGVAQTAFDLPEAISVTSRRDIDTRPYTVWSQVLREEPGILLQQTTSAQTSPVIRGFTGQSNVYLLDGVRLNTAAWRPGPSQYLAWVDGGPIDGVEIVRGGGSVQYGSDALGGTVQLRSAPAPWGLAPAPLGGVFELSGGTADRNLGAQARLWLRAGSAIVAGGGGYRDVDDLRAGAGLDSHSAITRFLGLPSTIRGTRLEGTAFTQAGAHLSADAAVGGTLFRALYMRGRQDGANRYDRLLGGAGLFRSGFDPQVLDFAVLRLAKAGVARLDGVSAAVSINRQSDGRFEQARPLARLDRQQATTTAFGYQVQAHHQLGRRHLLLVGGELYDESIAASRELVEPDGAVLAARPDIPGRTSFDSLGMFAQQTARIAAVTLRGGVRYSRFTFSTVEQPALGVVRERVATQAVTFQSAASVAVSDSTNITANYSRGFRAPNAADLGGIGLTGGGGFEIAPSRASAMGAFVGSTGASTAVTSGVKVPASLRPELAHQYEVGLKMRRHRFSVQANAFAMALAGFIQRRALIFDRNVIGSSLAGFDIVRQDPSGAAYIALDPRPIMTRVNVGRARIVGFDAEAEMRVRESWTANVHVSMATGRTLPARDYLRRIPPPLGGVRLRWNRQSTWVEGVASFAATQKRLSADDLEDPRSGAVRSRSTIAGFFNGAAVDLGLVRGGILLATGESLAEVQQRVLGTAASAPLFVTQPGFLVVGLRAGARVTSRIDVTLLGDNLGDVNYRLYGSGIDGAGLGLQARLRYRF